MSEGGYIYHFPRLVLRKDKTNPRRLAYLFLLLFAVPPSAPVLAVGCALVLAGVAFHGWAAGYLARAGYSDRDTVLTLRGPYRHNRNPYYVAHLVMDLGFFCVAGLAPFYLLYLPVIFAVYRRWVLNEEPFLQQEFGEEYAEMCREVPRWGVRLTPAPARGPEQPFTWSMYWFNGEQWRSGSHLLLLGVFGLYYAFGNPLAGLPDLVLATFGAAVAAYYLLRDIRPRDTSRLSRGWLSVAAALAAAGVAFLLSAPLWQVWPAPWGWLGRGLGLLGGGALAAALLPSAAPRGGAGRGEAPTAPMVPWYLGMLALGATSATLGGVWLALIASGVLWALSIAGALTVRVPPRSVATAIAAAGALALALAASFYGA